MYVDKTIESMQKAMGETARRREIQIRCNEEHGTILQIIKKGIHDLTAISRSSDTDIVEDVPNHNAIAKVERQKTIKKPQKQMQEAAEIFDSELAAQLRDTVLELKAMDQNQDPCKSSLQNILKAVNIKY